MKALIILSLICIISPAVFAQSATVTWTTTHQTMDGFGGMTWLYQPVYTAEQMNTFYSSTSGIGLQIIRTANEGCVNYLTTACTIVPATMPELVTVKNVVTDGAVVELTLLPPANLKYSGNFNSGTAGADGSCVDTSNFSALATFTINWINMMSSNGAPITYLFPFNEPGNGNQMGGCVWTAAGIDAYIKVLGPALAGAGNESGTSIPFSSIKIGIADGGLLWSPDYVSTCLNDATCAQYVTIVSAHGYGTKGAPDGFSPVPPGSYCCATASAAPSSAGSRHIWMNEINGGFTYQSAVGLWSWDPSMADAMVWARNIHDYLTVTNVSGYLYWELADCCVGEPGSTGALNDGLTLIDATTKAKRYYVVGNWSKYVRSGWVRIDATVNPASGVYVTAFKDPSSDNFAIVAINQNSSAVTVDFSLSGFPSVASVTPTVTSASVNLEDQPDVTVTGAAFSDSLPAISVVTFHVTSTSSSSKIPASPTGLTLTIK